MAQMHYAKLALSDWWVLGTCLTEGREFANRNNPTRPARAANGTSGNFVGVPSNFLWDELLFLNVSPIKGSLPFRTCPLRCGGLIFLDRCG